MATIEHSAVADLVVPFAVRVSRKDVADILCTAFEGGSTYWLRRVDEVRLVGAEGAYKSDVPSCGGALRLRFDDPKQEEGNGKGRFTLRLDDVLRGIGLAMGPWRENGSGYSLAQICGDEADAETADVVLQMAVFGEVIFG